jgi:hypothetical protein
MNGDQRDVASSAVGRVAIAVTLALLSAFLCTPAASGAARSLADGEALLRLSGGLDSALRQAGVKVKAVKPAKLAGRRLTASISSGSFDVDAGRGAFELSGGLKLLDGRRTVVLREIRLDAGGKRFSAIVAGKRVQLARLAGAKLADEGFGARLEAPRLPLTRAGAAALNRVLALPEVLRAGRSLGSVDGFGEPSSVDVAFGSIAIGGPDTTFSKLASIGVDMGLWGGSEGWGEGAERAFLFPLGPTTVATDGRTGVLAGGANDGITFQSYSSPPRDMLLRGPRIDLAAGELSATVSGLAGADLLTGTIATLDYSGATFQVRPKVGAFELMGIRAVAGQFIADQLSSRFGSPGMFQAGETLARVTVTMYAAP